MTFSSDDSAEDGHNVNIKTTEDLFRVVQVGRARNIREKRGKKLCSLVRAFLALNHVHCTKMKVKSLSA